MKNSKLTGVFGVDEIHAVLHVILSISALKIDMLSYYEKKFSYRTVVDKTIY